MAFSPLLHILTAVKRVEKGEGSALSNLDGSEYYSKCPEMFFRDGKRRIDFVLVYEASELNSAIEQKRSAFLSALADQMIEIEVENCLGQILAQTYPSTLATGSPPHPSEYQQGAACNSTASMRKDSENPLEAAILANKHLIFVKLHASWFTMIRVAEVLQLKKPLKQSKVQQLEVTGKSKLGRGFELDSKDISKLPEPYRAVFSRTRINLFEIPEDYSNFFTPSERTLVVDYVLKRTGIREGDYSHAYGDSHDRGASSNRSPIKSEQQHDKVELGISHFIQNKIFIAAFPLHDPSSELMKLLEERNKETQSQIGQTEKNMRTLLCDQWSSLNKIFKYQPLDYIRLYFGESIAFYFAWLGLYTYWLIPVAIFGLLVFCLAAIDISDDKVVDDICIHGSKLVMCPTCSRGCHFWLLNASCFSAKLTHLVDNVGTVLFAIFMAVWATLFMEHWKRYQNILAHRWNVECLEPIDEPPRPEFIALLKTRGYRSADNIITGRKEPRVPFWSNKLPFTLLSYVTVFFGVVLCLAALVGVVFYRLIVNTLLRQNENVVIVSVSGVITTVTSSVINLVCIFILKLIYDRIAIKLTDMEDHRTQSEYDKSLTLKLYILQFVNFYSSIFYIAFIQGPTAALPGDGSVPIRSSGCDNGNCLFQLFIQLAIVMVGKQILNFVTENSLPSIKRRLNVYLARQRISREGGPVDGKTSKESIPLDTPEEALLSSTGERPILYNCRENFTLLDGGSRPLFEEYLEMVTQYGFITMFVAAFPIAPLFALLNNIFEVRTDAKKFLRFLRRPVIIREGGIGVWFGILAVISSLAIRTNACLIAFTSGYLERLIYIFAYSSNRSLEGYLNFTLSYMNASRFEISPKDAMLLNDSAFCRYRHYREHPSSSTPYAYTPVYWHMLALKFAFVFIFENVAMALKDLIDRSIPDMPENLVIVSRHRTRVINELIVQTELKEGSDVQEESFESATHQSPPIRLIQSDAQNVHQVGFVYALPKKSPYIGIGAL